MNKLGEHSHTVNTAEMFYGDAVGGVTDSSTDGDFLTELAREVLRGAELAVIHDQSVLIAILWQVIISQYLLGDHQPRPILQRPCLMHGLGFSPVR